MRTNIKACQMIRHSRMMKKTGNPLVYRLARPILVCSFGGHCLARLSNPSQSIARREPRILKTSIAAIVTYGQLHTYSTDNVRAYPLHSAEQVHSTIKLRQLPLNGETYRQLPLKAYIRHRGWYNYRKFMLVDGSLLAIWHGGIKGFMIITNICLYRARV